MQTIRVIGQVGEDHRLIATLPDTVEPGQVEVLVIARSADEDDAGEHWTAGIAREWHDDLADPRQDIYSLTDGVPVDGSR
jgi:hypothetical protein